MKHPAGRLGALVVDLQGNIATGVQVPHGVLFRDDGDVVTVSPLNVELAGIPFAGTLYLSDNPDGVGVCAESPQQVAFPEGVAVELSPGTRKCFFIAGASEFPVALSHDSEKTVYLVLVLPDGRRAVSPPITL